MFPTLRKLQYFKLLAKTGAFSRAAEAAHVTVRTLDADHASREIVVAWRSGST